MGVELSSAPQAQIHYKELRVTRPQQPPAQRSDLPPASTPTAQAQPSSFDAPPPTAPASPPGVLTSLGASTQPTSPSPSSAAPPSDPPTSHEASETAPEDRPAAT